MAREVNLFTHIEDDWDAQVDVDYIIDSGTASACVDKMTDLQRLLRLPLAFSPRVFRT